jgi:hypothetical protein
MWMQSEQQARQVIADLDSEFVGALPKALLTAIAVFEASEVVQEPYPLIPDDITEKNVEQVMLDVTETLVLADRWWDARNRVKDQLAQRVLTEAADAVPAIIERLRPQFDSAATEYKAAVADLPDDTTPAGLVHAPNAATGIESYRRVLDLEAQLGRFHAFCNTLQNVPGHSTRLEPIAYLLRPTTRNELQALIDASATRERDGLSPVYLKAVELGIEFQLNTPAEAAAIVDEVNAMPVKYDSRLRYVTLR